MTDHPDHHLEAMARAHYYAEAPHDQAATWEQTLPDFRKRRLNAMRAALKSLPPEGWRAVPVEPTPEMVKAGQTAADDDRWRWCGLGARPEGTGLDGMTSHATQAYRAMIAAAPLPTPPEGT